MARSCLAVHDSGLAVSSVKKILAKNCVYLQSCEGDRGGGVSILDFTVRSLAKPKKSYCWLIFTFIPKWTTSYLKNCEPSFISMLYAYFIFYPSEIKITKIWTLQKAKKLTGNSIYTSIKRILHIGKNYESNFFSRNFFIFFIYLIFSQTHTRLFQSRRTKYSKRGPSRIWYREVGKMSILSGHNTAQEKSIFQRKKNTFFRLTYGTSQIT